MPVSLQPPVAWDFANVLFAGPCNRFCPFCIGNDVAPRLNQNNLDVFPPRNWENFVAEARRLAIREIIFTGTTTDPHLYRHEAQLIERLRLDLPEAKVSIHTNGVLTLRKISEFNSYDRATISFPTFDAEKYQKIMGVRGVPDMEQILRVSEIPVKISTVLTEYNTAELDSFIRRLAEMGIRRVALRQLAGDNRRWKLLEEREPTGFYRGNPVYAWHGAEVTHWNFDTTESRSINLFSNGTIGNSYLLTQTALNINRQPTAV